MKNINNITNFFCSVLLLMLLEATGVLLLMGSVVSASDGPPLPRMTRLSDLEGSYTDLTGQTFSLGDLRGKVVVINLWATWCPPCRREMPVLVAGAQRYPHLRFLLVNQGEDQPTVDAAAAQWSIPVAMLALDPDSAVSTALGVRGYPTTLLVAADGRIVGRHTGEVSGASLAALIEDLESDSRTRIEPRH
jgi:thiol-disulfide isomerase/thioredoxin